MGGNCYGPVTSAQGAKTGRERNEENNNQVV